MNSDVVQLGPQNAGPIHPAQDPFSYSFSECAKSNYPGIGRVSLQKH